MLATKYYKNIMLLYMEVHITPVIIIITTTRSHLSISHSSVSGLRAKTAGLFLLAAG